MLICVKFYGEQHDGFVKYQRALDEPVFEVSASGRYLVELSCCIDSKYLR